MDTAQKYALQKLDLLSRNPNATSFARMNDHATTIVNNPAWQIEYVVNFFNPIHAVEVFVIKGKFVYNFYYSDFNVRFSDILPTTQEMINTFQFTK